MGKPVYDGIEFDSLEEYWIYFWIGDAQKLGLIEKYKYQPRPWELSGKKTYTSIEKLKTKTKFVEKHLLHPHSYQADYALAVRPSFHLTCGKYKIHSSTNREDGLELVYIDVKGKFNPYHDGKSFSINQKWMHDKYGIIINKVIPDKLFKATWVPDQVRIGKSGKALKRWKSCLSFKEFLQENPDINL